ncbi:MAG: hypothetical protein ABW216_04500 [Candidatus Rokuibacteriota bacterium]
MLWLEAAADMSLVLTYEGALPSRNAESANAVKNRLRRAFHPQLLEYCAEDQRFRMVPTMSGGIPMNGFRFIGLVGGLIGGGLFAELKIEMLRRGSPGSIFSGGDIDGRLKTLLDGLRLPHSAQELHGFQPTGDAAKDFCVCLRSDDSS